MGTINGNTVDTFETEGEAPLAFTNAVQLPGGFFHRNSEPFMGVVKLHGHAFRTLEHGGRTYNTGHADTAVLRKTDVVIHGNSGHGQTEIELVKLLLKGSIEVKGGPHTETWDLTLSLSPTVKSTGTMTITQTSAAGGHFSSKLVVVPHLEFERRADGARRSADTGAMPFTDEQRALLTKMNTLESSNVRWAFATPALREAALSIAELSGNFVVQEPIIHIGPHPKVIPTRPGTLPQ